MSDTSVAEALLYGAISDAEWRDKHIYPLDGEDYQEWKLTIYLPVPLSETDKSPEAALRRALQSSPPKRAQERSNAESSD